MTKVDSFPISSQTNLTPLIPRKLFDLLTLQFAINVLCIEYFLEENNSKKKRIHEDVSPSKDLIMKITSFHPSKKTKNKKEIPKLSKNLTTGHMIVEITKPQNEGKIHELSIDNF